jgi:hypothetical protein
MAGRRGESHGQPGQMGQPPSKSTNSDQYWRIAVGSHLIFSLGMVFAVFLFFSLAPESIQGTDPFNNLGSGDWLFAGLVISFLFSIFLSPLLSLGVGFYIGRTAGDDFQAPSKSAIMNAAAILATMAVLIFLIILFSPDSGGGGNVGSDLGKLIGPVIGLGVANGVVGSASAYLSENFAPS